MKRILITIFFALALLMCLTPAATASPPAQAGDIVVLHDSVESPGTSPIGLCAGHRYRPVLQREQIHLYV